MKIFNVIEKIGKIIKIYKDTIYIFVTLFILIWSFNYIGFTNEYFSIFVYLWLILYISYFLFFRLSVVENFIINKITYILIIAIILMLYSQTNLWITNKDVLFMIWGIIAFWYWYKKYERDKEIEIINNVLNFSDNDEYEVMIRRWYMSLLLNEKWYMKDVFFDIIDSHCWSIFVEFILKSKNNTEIQYKIAKTLLIFNKHPKNILFLNKLMEMWKEDSNPNNNMNEFVRIILILKDNKYEH